MKKIIVLSLLLSFSLTSCTGQEKTEKNTDEKDTIQPRISSSVHKEYDENGNLISIDSTYSYFYSNIKNDSILEQKFFKDFKMGFDDNFPAIDSLFMRDFFSDTPFRMNDFYTDDFFENRFELRQKSMRDIFKRMDSLKNSYYLDRKNEIKKQM
ncbi:hypothetical protein UMM65_07515 [Aureibaculum sp. 2210JD6-5]|uniref:hypothetical protein n=1 Tax=Aureibaculum sp. 2210JD6-5 TaxID=3103957 RepID=UPI002AAD70B3|nr:hypothetical protein [Aureibaculum sp. 2210JD6-5]MDY7395085.1 hypothetical protein [Aureibaculum sp. 2210JD6-5]